MMEDYPRNSFERHVRRTANLRSYDASFERIEHEIKLNHDMTYLRLIVVAADLYVSYAPFDMPNWRLPDSREVSGEFIAR